MARHYDPERLLAGDSLDAWHSWARTMGTAGLSPRTTENRAESCAQFQEYLNEHHAGTGIIDATESQVADYLIHMGATRSKATQANRHRALRTFYNFLADREIVTRSPMAKLKICDPEYKQQPVWTDEQLKQLLAACRPPKGRRRGFEDLRDEAVIRLWCEPGSPRLSELADMNREDADLSEAVARIRRGKGGRPRLVGMSSATAEALWLYCRARSKHPHNPGDAGALWIGRKGPLTISGLARLLARRATMAGLPHINPHSLRNTAFSDFDSAGGSINDAMALFGWSHPDMAIHYGKQARDIRAVAKAREMRRGDRLVS